ncbi:MAG: SIMPL domain-containing protein [Bacteroidota bacterium]
MKYLITLLATLSFFYCKAQTKNFIDQPYISVNGYADTFVTPNEIFIKITLSEKDSKDRVSVEEQEAKLVKGLTALGINTETNLSVFDFGSNYRFYFLKKKDIIKTKQYTLKVTDAVMVGKVFMMLEENDMSNAVIDRVDHSNLENIQNQARIKAVENARDKAVAMSTVLKQSIGHAIHISDNEGSDNTNRRYEGAERLLLRSVDKYKYDTPKLDFEKIKVAATVSVQFVLK